MPVALHVVPLVALFAWVPISLFFFYRLPVRIAVLVNFVAGWGLLPTANFVPSDSPFPYWILGVCLPAGYFVTKATITGVAGLAGVLLFDPRGMRRFRPTVWDLPMALWCAVPLLSGAANHAAYRGAVADGLRGMAYQVLAWGVPYVLGRVYFCDDASLRLAAKAFVIAGLCYVPICLVELYAGPQFYAHAYGYQPYRWLGAERYVGFRPVGFLEDGNQLGIWMASATLSAAGLWKEGIVRRVLGLPIGWACAALFGMTVLCQSGGSIVLLVGLLPFVLLRGRTFRRGFVAALVVMVLGLAGLRLANVVSLRRLVSHEPGARAFAMFLQKIGRSSFGWRLEQDERHVKAALGRPWLGSGQWDWWKSGAARPWGLWLLAFGMYGGVGLLALEALQFGPVLGAAWLPTPRGDPPAMGKSSRAASESRWQGMNLRVGLAAVLLLTAIDNLLNGDMILPLVLVIGGMSVWKNGVQHLGATIGDNQNECLHKRMRPSLR